MNENPEGTPNPLNPNPAAGAMSAAGTGAVPAAAPVTPAQPVMPTPAAPSVTPTTSAMPVMPTAGETPAPAPAAPTIAPTTEPVVPPAATPVTEAVPIQTATPVSAPTAPVSSPVPPVSPVQTAQAAAQPTQPNLPHTGGQAMDFMSPAQAAAQPMASPATGTAELVAEAAENSAAEALAAALAEGDMAATPAPAEPVAKDSVVAPAKPKKKTPMLIGIILIGVAVICGLAAVLVMLLNQEDDHVALAMEQAFSADAATKVGVEGTITIQDAAEDAAVPRIKIELDGAMDNNNGENSAEATLTATLANESTIEFNLGEVKTEDGDTFIRVSGVQEAIQGLIGQPDCATSGDGTEQCAAETVETCDEEGNCVTEAVETVDLAGVYDALLNMLGTVDGEWLRFPAATNETEDESGLDDLLDLSSSVCMVSTIGNLSNYGATIGQLYTANPFITSSTDNVKITAKSNNGMVYRLGVDDGKLGAFTSALNNSQLGQDYRSCAGDSLPTMADVFYTVPPRIEVEVDKTTNRFTRMYFDATLANETTSVTMDLVFSYPGTVAVTAPTEYVDGMEMLTNMFMQFFNTSIIEGEVVETTE